MATQTYKILGQVNPTANTLSNVYVVPAATEGVVNSIIISKPTKVHNIIKSFVLNISIISFLYIPKNIVATEN